MEDPTPSEPDPAGPPSTGPTRFPTLPELDEADIETEELESPVLRLTALGGFLWIDGAPPFRQHG